MTPLSLIELRADALRLLQDVAPGSPLEPLTVELLAFAVRMSVTALDPIGGQAHAERALALGASAGQFHEALALVSGLGVHTLFVGTGMVNRLVGVPNQVAPAPLDPERQQLWDKWVGQDRYWGGFERAIPGFLRDLLQVSPHGFDAFFQYCAVPWKTAHLSPLTKELLAMACDATPTHRYLPGMRLHLANALKLGAGREAVLQALDIAAAAPQHAGVA